MGTYNFVVPVVPPNNPWSQWDVRDAFEFLAKGAGHLAVDWVPYKIGGNVRGPN